MPRDAVSTGSGLTPNGRIASGPPEELDHELAHAPAAAAAPGWPPRPRRVATQRASGEGKGSIGAPVQPVACSCKLEPAAGRRLGHPHRDDVVVDLVVGRDLDQLHRAFAPVAQRLDPQARAAVVADAVQVMVELAVALQQAEAARDCVGEGRGAGPAADC